MIEDFFFPCFPYFPGKIYVGLCITSAVYPILCPSIHQGDKKEFVRACVYVRMFMGKHKK